MAYTNIDYTLVGGATNPTSCDFKEGNTTSQTPVTLTYSDKKIISACIFVNPSGQETNIIRIYGWNSGSPTKFSKYTDTPAYTIENVGTITTGGIAEVTEHTISFTPANDSYNRRYKAFITLE